MFNKSLYMFSPQNKFRRFLHEVLKLRHFDNCLLGVIFLSAITMSLENPLRDPNGNMIKALTIIDMFITAIFVIEAATRIIVYGFIFNGKASYMKSGWNVFDFSIVIISVRI